MELAVPTPQVAAAPATVLVVDDSRAIRDGMTAILGQAGYRTETAANGREGFAKARSLSPDLILSDLEMPESTGFDLLSQVRSDPTLAMLPFVMITGVSDRLSTRRAMEMGADDYLTKPFSPPEVLAIVRSRLEKQRSWRQATQALARSYSQGMMGVLPHEFRTPLHCILGFAELMSLRAAKGLSPAQTKEFADVIRRAGKTLLGHTTRFLTLMEYQGCATPERGSSSCCLSPAGIETLVNECLGQQLPTNQVSAVVTVEAAKLACGESVLGNMVRELVGNAVKFARPESAIQVRGRREDGRYLLQVDNEGRPFPLERLREVGAFTQFDRDRHEQQGLGIGLAIVTQGLRIAGATLDIHNLPDNVVRMNLGLPLA
ncbi:MAG: hypothetical protein RIR00_1000 [Pseudomonadota bacterium]|jgi:CheY-like chemotaxis protein